MNVPVRTRLGQHRVAGALAGKVLRRSLGRSIAILILIALPVAAFVGAAVVVRSATAAPSELAAVQLGQAQAALQVVNRPDPSLRQEPNDPTTWQIDRDADLNPVHPDRGPYAEPAALLPPGSSAVPLSTTATIARSGRQNLGIAVVEGRAWDPALAGRYDVVSGRAPADDSEIAATRAALARLHASVGDRIQVIAPRQSRVRIVGVIRDGQATDARPELFARTAAITERTPTQLRTSTTYYASGPAISWAEVQKLNQQGLTVLSRSVLLDPPTDVAPLDGSSGPAPSYTGSYVAEAVGFAATEILLLAGAAFSITARRQTEFLAVISSVGAPPAVLRRTITLIGTGLGLAGGALGSGLGVAAAATFIAVTRDGSRIQYPTFTVPVVWIIVAIGLAGVIGWLSAARSAREAARVDVLAVLRGVSRPPLARRRRPLAGLAVLGAGAAATLAGAALFGPFHDQATLLPIVVALLLLGPIGLQLGAVLCGPLLLNQYARLFQNAPLATRLAVRDLARNPRRTVPAIAAITAATFAAVALLTFVGALQAGEDAQHVYQAAPGQLSVPLQHRDENGGGLITHSTASTVTDAIRGTVPLRDTRLLVDVPGSPLSRTASQPVVEGGTTTGIAQIWVGTPADLAAMIGQRPTAAATTALDRGAAVVLDPNLDHDDQVRIAWWSAEQYAAGAADSPQNSPTPPLRTATLPAVLQRTAVRLPYGIVISPSTADRLRLQATERTVLATPAAALTNQQTDALQQALQVSTGRKDLASYEAGPASFSGPVIIGLFTTAALIVFAAAISGLALATLDRTDDDRTLMALGLAPTTRRRLAATQALLITSTGTITGTLMGLLPGTALTSLNTLPIAPPWPAIAALTVLPPILLAAITRTRSPADRISQRGTGRALPS